MKRIFFVLLSLLFLGACQNSTGGGAVSSDVSGYEMETVPGSSWQRATKKNENGDVIEQGFFENGVKVGTWVTYPAGNEFPAKIISYVNGMYHGNYYEFNERGQLQLKAGYKSNQLHGDWGKYRFGRPEKSATYVDGQLDGVLKEYFSRDGTLQKEIHYKNGKQHGPFRHYNEEGQVTLEYEYKNGEKVGGGIVDPAKENEPK